MAGKTAVKVPNLGIVTPPKMRRGKEKVQLAAEVVAAWAENIAAANGEFVSDASDTYDSRAKASSMAGRIKTALVETGKAEKDSLTSRVYSTNDEDYGKKSDEQVGPFAFALGVRSE